MAQSWCGCPGNQVLAMLAVIGGVICFAVYGAIR
jgi:hypothetical protein